MDLFFKRGQQMNSKNALNRFKQILGEYCAINQFVELSKRVFVYDHEVDLSNRESFVSLSKKHKIAITTYDLSQMTLKIALSYIVNIHQCFETFLKDIYNLNRAYGIDVGEEKKQDNSWLICVSNNTLGVNKSKKEKNLVQLCEYYRLIRNIAVHDFYKLETHLSEYNSLPKDEYKTDAKFQRLEAPNKYENISFDDFVMYSRSCNELATILYDKLEFDYKKIIQAFLHTNISRFTKYKNNSLRGKNALYLDIKLQFKDSPKLREEIDELFHNIMAR